MAVAETLGSSRFSGRHVAEIMPGLFGCMAVSGLAWLVQRVELGLAGRAWLDTLVLAILVGVAVRAAGLVTPAWERGIAVCAHLLLEVAVVLLGASVSVRAIAAAGPGLIAGIAGVVVLAICTGYAMGRLLRLPHRMALLVACGNSICGNSAIAAVAPVIGACAGDVAAAIAFTAVFGVAVVLALPLAVPLLHLSGVQYGTLAGLTVYAVPQVLAATTPVGALAVQVGTLVKLVRVLMLGPVVLVLSVLGRRGKPACVALPLHRLVPWFIVGFLALAAARAGHVVPRASLTPMADAASVLTILAMAGLGLGTDLRAVASAGARVTGAVVMSLLVLGGLALALIRLLGV
jgi:uncharacterized integral membrane protein (TIGR00698 family)